MRRILARIIGLWIAPLRIELGVDERRKVAEWTAHSLCLEKTKGIRVDSEQLSKEWL